MLFLARKRIWILMAFTFLLTVQVFAVDPASDPVGYTVEQMEDFQSSFSVPVTEYDELMHQVFLAEPRLYYYYSGASYSQSSSGLSIQMGYRNQGIDMDDIQVVSTPEQFYAAIGIAEYSNLEHVALVVLGTFMDEAAIDEAFDILNDRYYLLDMCYHGYSYSYMLESDYQTDLMAFDISMIFSDGVDSATAASWKNDTEAALLTLSETLFAQDMPDWMREYLIHDYLIDNNVYDSYTPDNPVNHVAYSALCTGKTVCQGYSEAAKLLFEAAGIPAYYVTGEAGGGSHGWNCVNIGGSWYMLDITWDDPVSVDGTDVKNYDYFNLTDSQLSQDHTWDSSQVPECTDTTMSASSVYQLLQADGGSYSDYSSRLVRTQKIQLEELLALFDSDQKPVTDPASGDNGETVPEDAITDPDTPSDNITDPDTPSDSIADSDTPADDTIPDSDTPQLENPLGIISVAEDPEEPEPGRTHTISVSHIFLWLILLLAAAAVMYAVYRTVLNYRVEDAREDRMESRSKKLRSSSIRGKAYRN